MLLGSQLGTAKLMRHPDIRTTMNIYGDAATELQAVLAEVVQAAGSDMFASDIVYSSVSAREKADEITNWSGFDAEAIKKVFGTRMRSRHPKPVSNVLPADADHPLAFSRWRVYVPEDVPYMTDYFRTAFDFSFQNLGTFLQWLLPGNVGYKEVPSSSSRAFTLRCLTSSHDSRRLRRMA